MPAPHLILLPSDPDYPATGRASLLTLLRELEFLGAPLETPLENGSGEAAVSGHYQAGERFLDLLSFMGCSPYVLTDPAHSQDQGFCHVYVAPGEPAPVFLAGEPLRPPRCPACGEVVSGWERHSHAGRTPCAACGAISAPPRWSWGRRAGWARIWLEVHGVFDGEAVPGEQLMRALDGLDGVQWRYIYGRRQTAGLD